MNAVLSAVGDNKLMPAPEAPSLVIPAKTGYARSNQSWILGRVLRDFDYWKDGAIEEEDRKKLAELREQEKLKAAYEKREYKESDVRIGLRLSIYTASHQTPAGHPHRDRVWWGSTFIIALQLAISLIPCVLYAEYTTLLVTTAGLLLSSLTSALPQWRLEKWACRRDTHKAVTLTAGNGSKDCIVILGAGCGLDLEDLATSRRVARTSTRLALGLLALGWLTLLISVAGFGQHTWYLMSVGGAGMISNLLVAGLAREPAGFGIHLAYKECILDRKVIDVLAQAETKYPRLGSSLLPTFFPGRLGGREEEWWEYAGRRAVEFERAREGDWGAVARPVPSLRGRDVIPKEGLL